MNERVRVPMTGQAQGLCFVIKVAFEVIMAVTVLLGSSAVSSRESRVFQRNI